MRKNIPDLDLFPYGKKRIEEDKGLKKVLYKVLPYHTLAQLSFELHMTMVRMKSYGKSKKFKEGKDLLLNIGSGSKGLPGWINIDGYSGENVNCLFDARKKLPFADNSVKGIFCEHFFEHIDYTEEVPYFLSECYRVLKPSGVLRIIVPDAGRFLMAYAQGGWETLTKLKQLDENQREGWNQTKYNTPMELINAVFRQGVQHKFAYDYETLDFVLRRYGFEKVKKQSFGESEMPEICIDQEIRSPESLYVEGIK